MIHLQGKPESFPDTRPVDTLKALVVAEKKIRLARAEIISLNQRLKALDRRVRNIEQWKGEQK